MDTFMPFVRESGFGPRSDPRRAMQQEEEESPEIAELLALLQGALGSEEPGLAGLFGSAPGAMPEEAPPTPVGDMNGAGLPPLIRMLLALDRGSDARAMRPDVGDVVDANEGSASMLSGLFGADPESSRERLRPERKRGR